MTDFTEPRPPLGPHYRTPEAISDWTVAHNAWTRARARKEAGDRVLADLLARRHVTPDDLRRAATELEEAS